MISVAVIGAAGRMGSITAATVSAQDDLRLVALVDPTLATDSFAGPPTFADVGAALAATSPDVAVEFSTPASVFANASTLVRAGVHTVVGATGLTAEQLDELGALSHHGGNLLVAPNFSLGAVLLMRFAREASRFFQHAEVIELHHDRKVDAPSGTALRTAALMSETPGSALRTPDSSGLGPSRGVQVGPVPIHSVRLPGLVAHQEVLFGGTGEVLTIRHDSLSRESFMAGVLLAVRRVTALEGPVVGLENILP